MPLHCSATKEETKFTSWNQQKEKIYIFCIKSSNKKLVHHNHTKDVVQSLQAHRNTFIEAGL